MTDRRLVNRAAESHSPYVKRHATNAVAWQPWSTETVELAKERNALIFVSIGYSSCHWCGVMERESFEEPGEVADILNSSFVPVKVDREERPDIDSAYMQFVQATTGSGGWPLNVFLTPELQPIFGGTYWPGPKSQSIPRLDEDLMGFVDVLKRVRDLWSRQEDKCRDNAAEIMEQFKHFAEEGTCSHALEGEQDTLELDLIEQAYTHFSARFDAEYGGFSAAPKFPAPTSLLFLLQLNDAPRVVKDVVGEEECVKATKMAIHTLRMMGRGGIRDQIGSGFFRYSITQDWSFPHFEKMLVDNVQLLDAYMEAYKISHDVELLGVIYDLVAFISELRMHDGGFCSSEASDSVVSSNDDTETKEGAYYVWSLREVIQVLGERDAEIFSKFSGILANGNISREHDPHDAFISQNVVQIKHTPATLARQIGIGTKKVAHILKRCRRELRRHRQATRQLPSKDDKIVVEFNGLAISALARCSVFFRDVIDDEETSRQCRQAASEAVEFIRAHLYDADTGELWRVYYCRPDDACRGDVVGFCSDYAYLINGLLELYEATFDESHLRFADELQQYLLHHFVDEARGGFFTYSDTMQGPVPPLRLKSGTDDSNPSVNGTIAQNLLRLSSFLACEEYRAQAHDTCQAFASELQEYPFLFVTFLTAISMDVVGMKNIAHIDSGTMQRKHELHGRDTTLMEVEPCRSTWLLQRNAWLREMQDLQTPRRVVWEARSREEK